MGWQKRGGGLFFYRSVRVGGRVRTYYLGAGPVAELAAAMEQLRQIELQEERQRWQATLARRRAADEALAELCAATRAVAHAALMAAGYHRPYRGAWRKRRAAKLGGPDMNQGNEGQSGGSADIQGLGQLVERAQRGDMAVLPGLRRLLDERPEIWQRLGDLSKLAEESLIGMAAGESLLLRECIRRKLADLKSELAPASPLEQIVVERIACCWVATNHADSVAPQAAGPKADQARRRQDSANRRFLESVKLLAMVRRLLGASKGGARPGNRGSASDEPAGR
jgi:hypothetical protein